jgi:peptidoglycan/xylan/chitin deacetylase (PgdA/CDA1 family)
LRIDEVRELASCPWVTIGAHSHCHNILTQLAPEEMRNSIATSKQLLESWAGRAVDYFAYPNGDANTEVMSVVKSCGFKCGLTTLPRPWNRRDSAFALPRIAVGRYDVEEVFRLNLVGGIAAIV